MGCLLAWKKRIQEKEERCEIGCGDIRQSRLCQSTHHKTKYRIRISEEKKLNRMECETEQCGHESGKRFKN